MSLPRHPDHIDSPASRRGSRRTVGIGIGIGVIVLVAIVHLLL